MRERACTQCKTLFYGNICPTCKSTSHSEDFSGLLIVLDPEKSEIAKKVEIKMPGRYALKVR
jgi:DNA-directed RNA polymerase subunit E"